MASRTRDQIDSEGAVLRSVRATVERHPSPPRPVDRVEVALSLYRGKAVKVLFFAALAAVLFAITFYTSGGPGTIWALRLVLGSCFLLFLLGPSRSTFT